LGVGAPKAGSFASWSAILVPVPGMPLCAGTYKNGTVEPLADRNKFLKDVLFTSCHRFQSVFLTDLEAPMLSVMMIAILMCQEEIPYRT